MKNGIQQRLKHHSRLRHTKLFLAKSLCFMQKMLNESNYYLKQQNKGNLSVYLRLLI